MISVLCWQWGGLFGPEYVNTLRSMLERHLHTEHRLSCVTDNAEGIDARVTIVPLPEEFSATPRCLRRLRQYDERWLDENGLWGDRILSIDLDVVITHDITPIMGTEAPLRLWYVPHSDIYCTSIVMYRPDVLHGLWRSFSADPCAMSYEAMRAIYPHRRYHIKPDGSALRIWYDASDQPIVNHYVRTSEIPVKQWTPDADGIIPYFGKGYRIAAPPMVTLPKHTRIVALGSADKHVLDNAEYPWVAEHWK